MYLQNPHFIGFLSRISTTFSDHMVADFASNSTCLNTTRAQKLNIVFYYMERYGV